MVSPLVVLFGLPFLLVGAVLLWYGGRLSIGLFRRHRQTRTLDGEIIDVGIEAVEEDTFQPRVRYRYDFRGQTYESNRLREGQEPPTGPKSVAEDIADNYDIGQTVSVTLLSGTPEQAALEPAADTWPYVVAGSTTLIGTIFALLGAGISVSGLLG